MVIIPRDKLPKGEMIVRGAVHFPEYSEKGSLHFNKGYFLIGGFHIHRSDFHIFGEIEFSELRNEEIYEFLANSPVDMYYCSQNRDIIKRYRKEINFASGLSGVDVSVCRNTSFDDSQSRYVIWDKVHQNKLFYKGDGIVEHGLNRLSVAKNDFSPQMECLVSLLSGIERNLYNDEQFDNAFN